MVVDDGARRLARRAARARAAARRQRSPPVPAAARAAPLPAVHAVPLSAAAGRLALSRPERSGRVLRRRRRCAPRARSSATGAGGICSTRRRWPRCRTKPQTVFQRAASPTTAVDLRERAVRARSRARWTDPADYVALPALRARRRARPTSAPSATNRCAIRSTAAAARCSTPARVRAAVAARAADVDAVGRPASASSGSARTCVRSEAFEFDRRERGRVHAAAGDRASARDARVRSARSGRTDYDAPRGARCRRSPTRATPARRDEIWLTEHPPIYTLGLAGRREHLLRDNGIPTLKVDRGGQVTYHGPGQLVVYMLFDLRRAAARRARDGPAHRGRGDRMARHRSASRRTASRRRRASMSQRRRRAKRRSPRWD